MQDFTGALIVWLRPFLAPAPVLAAVPRERPLSFVVVRRIGGPYEPPAVDHPTITVDAWAGTQAAAWELCQQARGRIFTLMRPGSIIAGISVYRIEEFAGPAWLPDPDTDGTPRYTTTLSIRHREHLNVT